MGEGCGHFLPAQQDAPMQAPASVRAPPALLACLFVGCSLRASPGKAVKSMGAHGARDRTRVSHMQSLCPSSFPGSAFMPLTLVPRWVPERMPVPIELSRITQLRGQSTGPEPLNGI